MKDTTKAKWIQLAISENEDNRKLALELLPHVAAEVQPELIFWFFFNQNFLIQKQIYNFLTEASKEQVEAFIGNIPPNRLLRASTTFQNYIYNYLAKHKELPQRLYMIREFMVTEDASLGEAKREIDSVC